LLAAPYQYSLFHEGCRELSRIGHYLITIVAAAVLVSIANTILSKKGAISSIFKLISGLILTITMVSPWTDFQFRDIQSLYSITVSDAANIAQTGQIIAKSQMSEFIMKEVQEYILDKAVAFDAELNVEVTVSTEDPPSITEIIFTGAISPFAKKQLSQIVCEELGVTEEHQIWR